MGDQSNDNYVSVKLGEVKNSCFVMMPFTQTSDRLYEKVFKAAITEAGIKPLRGDEIYGDRRIMSDIWEAIRESRLVLAELTGKNANVLYELGLAHAIGKAVIIVTSELNDVPYDLRDLRCIVYDKNHPDWDEQLKKNLKETIVSVIEDDVDTLLKDIDIRCSFPDISVPEESTPRQSEEYAYDISGEWELVENYAHGRTTGKALLTQEGNEISGIMTIHDKPDNADGFVVEERISGLVNGKSVALTGTSYKLMKGEVNEYYLDQWQGTIKDADTILGNSSDFIGTGGDFTMRRL